MRYLALILAVSIFFAPFAPRAEASGFVGSGGGGGGAVSSAGLDAVLGSTRGTVAERGASGWGATGVGTAAQVLTSNGANTDPTFQDLPLAPRAGTATARIGGTALGIGSGAAASGINALAVGPTAHATATNSVAIGGSTTTTGASSVAVGFGAGTGGIGAVSVGTGASGVGIAIGHGAGTNNAGSVVIGDTASDTADQQFVAGGTVSAITDVYFGNGPTGTQAWTLHGGAGLTIDTQSGNGNITLSPNGTGVVALGKTTSTGMTVGAATGGYQGAGTINATGLYVNGVSVAGGGGSQSLTSVLAVGSVMGAAQSIAGASGTSWQMDASGIPGLYVQGFAATGATAPGRVQMAAGDAVDHNGGTFVMSAGSTTGAGDGGDMTFNAGGSGGGGSTGNGGTISFVAGVSGHGNAGGINFYADNNNDLALRITNAASVVVNATGSNLAQNARDGFLYIPRCASGAPSGTPTAQTGAGALVIGGDHHLYAELTSGSFSQIDGGGGSSPWSVAANVVSFGSNTASYSCVIGATSIVSGYALTVSSATGPGVGMCSVSGGGGITYASRAAGDTGERWKLTADASMSWGNGSGSFGSTLTYPSAGLLRFSGKVTSTDYLGVGVNSAGVDTNYALTVGRDGAANGAVFYGGGAAQAVDVKTNESVTSPQIRLRSGTSPAVLMGDGSATPTTGLFVGTGSPESVVTAGIGSLYMRKDGAGNTSLYVKESGSGNTGWVAK